MAKAEGDRSVEGLELHQLTLSLKAFELASQAGNIAAILGSGKTSLSADERELLADAQGMIGDMKKYSRGRLLLLGNRCCLGSSEEMTAARVLDHYSDVVGRVRDGKPLVNDEGKFLAGCRELFEHTQAVFSQRGLAIAASMGVRTTYSMAPSGEQRFVLKASST